MRKYALIFTLSSILVGCISTQAQTEYGKPDELRGLKKVFVDTGGDMKNRERIQEQIEDAKLGIILLDSEEGAEVVLTFGAGKNKRLGGSISKGTGSIFTKTYNTGEGAVYVVRDGKLRTVLGYEGEEKHLWEKKPATNFGKRFVKAWKKANDIK